MEVSLCTAKPSVSSGVSMEYPGAFFLRTHSLCRPGWPSWSTSSPLIPSFLLSPCWCLGFPGNSQPEIYVQEVWGQSGLRINICEGRGMQERAEEELELGCRCRRTCIWSHGGPFRVALNWDVGAGFFSTPLPILSIAQSLGTGYPKEGACPWTRWLSHWETFQARDAVKAVSLQDFQSPQQALQDANPSFPWGLIIISLFFFHNSNGKLRLRNIKWRLESGGSDTL